jgi:hypothetical protein
MQKNPPTDKAHNMNIQYERYSKAYEVSAALVLS